MNPQSDSNSSDINAFDTADTALAATRRDSSLASVASIPASPFADQTRHDQTRHDQTRHDQTRHDQTDVEQDEHVHLARNGALWLLLSLIAFYSVFSLGAWSAKRSSQPPIIGPFASRSKAADAKVVVHVAGAVQHPGVYILNSNARVFEALEKAGGALPQAETDALNLADWAQDGARLEVPFKAKTLRAASTATTPNTTQEAAASQTAPAATTSATSAEAAVATAAGATPAVASDEPSVDTSQGAVAQSTATPTKTATPAPIPAQSSTRLPRETTAKSKKPRSAKAATKAQSKTVAGLPRALTPDGKLSDNASPQYLAKHPLDLNKITREQLEALPGVGPSLAQKILDYRAQNSGFKNVDELDSVSGIGAKKLAALKPLLYVVGSTSVASQAAASSAETH